MESSSLLDRVLNLCLEPININSVQFCSVQDKSGDVIETTRYSFFDNETTFVFITSRSMAN